MFERTWDVAIQLCRMGRVQGQKFAVGVAESDRSSGTASPGRHWAVVSQEGRPIFLAPTEEEAEAGALFTVARRFIELEDAHQKGIDPAEYLPEPRRTFRDSLREWGLMDEQGRVLKAYEYDPEPLLGYVVRVGE